MSTESKISSSSSSSSSIGSSNSTSSCSWSSSASCSSSPSLSKMTWYYVRCSLSKRFSLEKEGYTYVSNERLRRAMARCHVAEERPDVTVIGTQQVWRENCRQGVDRHLVAILVVRHPSTTSQTLQRIASTRSHVLLEMFNNPLEQIKVRWRKTMHNVSHVRDLGLQIHVVSTYGSHTSLAFATAIGVTDAYQLRSISPRTTRMGIARRAARGTTT